jgi:hypothetical protein
MSKEDTLREVFNDAAQELAQRQTNPRTWLSWIVYLLARLEERTTASPADRDSYLEMLEVLQGEIRNRMRTGGWH